MASTLTKIYSHITGPFLNKNMLDIQAMIDEKIQKGGGIVHIPAGVWDVRPFEIPNVILGGRYNPQISVVGASPSWGGYGATVLRFKGSDVNISGTRETCIVLSNPGCSIENVFIDAFSNADRPKYGILIRAHSARVQYCTVARMALDGIVVKAGANDTPPSNANHFVIIGGSLRTNGRHGLSVDGGPETNAGLISHVDITANDGWGIYESGFLGNVYVGLEIQNNDMGDIYIENASNYSSFFGVYVEGQNRISVSSSVTTAFGSNAAQQMPFPGRRFSSRSQVAFIGDTLGDPYLTIPANAENAAARITTSGSNWYRLLEDYSGNIAYLQNCLNFLRHENAAYASYGITAVDHQKGGGWLNQGAPAVETPFNIPFRTEFTSISGGVYIVEITKTNFRSGSGTGSLFIQPFLRDLSSSNAPAQIQNFFLDPALGKLTCKILVDAIPAITSSFAIEGIGKRFIL